MRCRSIIVAFLALLVIAARAHAADEALLAAGRALSEQFEQGDTAPIYERMTPPMRQAVKSAQGLAEFRAQVLRDAGPETGVIREDATTQGSFRVYRRIARRNVGQTPTLMEWTLDATDHVAGFVVRPQPIAIPSSRLDEPTRQAAAAQYAMPTRR